MPRKLTWMLRPDKSDKKSVADANYRSSGSDDILEREFAKWLRVREPQRLCEMFGAQLAEQFGLDRLVFLTVVPTGAPPESLFCRGVTDEIVRKIKADLPPPVTSSRPQSGRVDLKSAKTEKNFQQFSLMVDAERGARVVGAVSSTTEESLARRQQYRLELWLGRFELALENLERIARLEALSYTDSLTGILNRRFFKRRLEEEITRAGRFSRSLSLVIFDLDRFKQLNDRFGHQSGDRVLREIAELLTAVARSIDIACRYGGDEFVIIMPETTLPNCFSFTNRLRGVIFDYEFRPGPRQDALRLSISLGAAVFPDHAKDPERLFWCADMALLKAKDGGGDQAVIFQPGMDTESTFDDHR